MNSASQNVWRFSAGLRGSKCRSPKDWFIPAMTLSMSTGDHLQTSFDSTSNITSMTFCNSSALSSNPTSSPWILNSRQVLRRTAGQPISFIALKNRRSLSVYIRAVLVFPFRLTRSAPILLNPAGNNSLRNTINWQFIRLAAMPHRSKHNGCSPGT